MKAILFIFCLCSASVLSTCHSIQKRLTFGTEAVPHSRPYQVHNVIMLRGGNVQICGGALISPNYVLTAAHCFANLENILQTIVIMGVHNLMDSNKEYQITKTYVIHKDYQFKPSGFTAYTKNDIALIQLDQPVKPSKNIQFISLPKRSQRNESFDNEIATEAGWGRTEFTDTSDVLIQGFSRIVQDEDTCTHPNPLMCSWSADGHAPCVGDSGSPLVLEDTVIGIVSVGFCMAVSYYTRVTSYLDWIEEHSDATIID